MSCRELLIPDDLGDDPLAAMLEKRVDAASINHMDTDAFDPKRGRQRLIDQFEVGLIHERRGLQSVADRLPRQIARRQRS